MQVSLSLLGPMEVTWADKPVIFATSAARALLSYLVLEADRAQPRELLATLLWPEQPQASAYTNLRQTLARVRKAFPVAPAPALLRITPRTLQFQPAAATVDVDRFEELVAACAVHEHAELISCPACLQRLQQAAALYRGELLQGLFVDHSQAFEEWLLVRRDGLHRQALELLQTLARAYETAGDYTRMLRYAARQLALEPWREDAHAQVMRAMVASGERAAALAQFARCRKVLADELGVEPDGEARALYDRLLAAGQQATRDIAASHHNLPAALTPFVGRETELAVLAAFGLQADVRLLTLVGAGGMGKTRLALEAARASLATYADGVFFVALAPLGVAEAIVSTIARALGATLHGSDHTAALLRWIADKQLLLILDNFEHLFDGVRLVVELLEAAPRVQIIVTSRECLNVRGEQVYGVEGLDCGREAPAAAASSAAMRLFVQSARRANPDFQLREMDLPALRRICELVGGMPLGLELAAAWVGVLSPQEIAQEITRDNDFLEARWPDAPERQRSMRAVFDWSWRLLSDVERQVLRRLSVFRGGFTREAAETVACATLRILASLQHKSLIHWRPGDGGAGRYEFHELLRQFAAEQLGTVPGEHAAEADHGAYYLQFVALRARRLGRDEPRKATAEIRAEIDNVRQAWTWGVGQRRVAELAQAAYGWWQFCLLTGQDAEGRRTFGLAVDHLRIAPGMVTDSPEVQPPPRGLSILLAIHANHLFSNAPYEQMAAEAREAIRLGAVSGDVEGETLGTYVLGRALQELEQQRDARELWQRAIRLARAYQPCYPDSELLHEADWLAHTWLFGSSLFFEDYAGGRASVVEALRISQALGKRRAELFSLASLAMIDFYMGDDLTAQRRYEQVLPLARALDDRWAEMRVQRELSEVLRVQGTYMRAHTLLVAVVATARELGIMYEEILALAGLVRLSCQLGDKAGARTWHEQLVERMAGMGVSRDCEAEGLRACAVYALCRGDYPRALADAEHAWQIAERVDIPNFRADSAVILGHARAGMNEPDAAAAYEQAMNLYLKIGNTSLASEAQAGLAGLALAEGDSVGAQRLVDAMLPVLAERPRARVLTPFYAYLICYRVLAANTDQCAATVLRTAQERLQEVADQISDPTLRMSFLEKPAAHRELLALAPPGALDVLEVSPGF